jgi:tryptophan synthase beta chain
MGEVDIVKQAPNVSRMKLLGAKVVPVSHGLRTLKEAVDSAFEAYLADYENSIYCIGSVVGPHPFPLMVRDFQRVVGLEAREQFQQMTGNLPEVVSACVGGGSNAIGIFSAFLDDPCELVGVEPLGRGEATGEHAATMTYGSEGIIHGFRCYLLQNEDGSPAPVYSCASGLDYPGVGPEHCYLKDTGRVEYVTCSDDECRDAFFRLCRLEGIIPAIESAHAVAYALVKAREMKTGTILVNLSGRGDKDLDYVLEHWGTGEPDQA